MTHDAPRTPSPASLRVLVLAVLLTAAPALAVPPAMVTGEVLTQAIAPLTLGKATLDVVYARAGSQAGPPQGTFTLEDTLSDGAQRTTLAFAGLGMMTGNLEAQSFFPPGKVADYTGFQHLRDNDPSNMGHNTSFLTRIANNVIHVLDDAQLARLEALAVSQIEQINLYGYKRFPLMKAFRRLLLGDLPSGATGLDLAAVKKASRELYLLDGRISFDRALLYAGILASLDPAQQAYLAAMKGKGWADWPDVTDEQVKEKMAGLPQGTAVAVMTYASDLFSWYAGSVEADVYFCPERQGTYFGSFYIKDAPAIGHEGYGIDEQLTATAGSALCDSSKGYVTEPQAALISSLVETQRDNLYASQTASIVKARTEIASLLRQLLVSTATAAAIEERVLELSGLYGELDGENNHHYATVFAQVYSSLSLAQKERLLELRRSILSGTYADGTPFDFTVCATPYLYSEAIGDVSVLSPYVSDTDFLFGVGTGTAEEAGLSVRLSPSDPAAAPGGTATVRVETSATGSLTGPIALAVTDLPRGLTAQLWPATVPATGNATSRLTIAIPRNVAAGRYPVTVTARSGSVSHTATFTLRVEAAAVPPPPGPAGSR